MHNTSRSTPNPRHSRDNRKSRQNLGGKRKRQLSHEPYSDYIDMNERTSPQDRSYDHIDFDQNYQRSATRSTRDNERQTAPWEYDDYSSHGSQSGYSRQAFYADNDADRNYPNQNSMSSYDSPYGNQRNEGQSYKDREHGSREQNYSRQGQGYRDSDNSYGGGYGPSSDSSSRNQDARALDYLDRDYDRNKLGVNDTRMRSTEQHYSGNSYRDNAHSTHTGYQADHMGSDYTGRGPKGYKRSDDRIREDVSEALEMDSMVDASEIEVHVKDGIVTLTGTVESRQAKRCTENCVERMRGVKDVINQLKVQSSLDASSSGGSSRNNTSTSASTTNRSETGSGSGVGRNTTGTSRSDTSSSGGSSMGLTSSTSNATDQDEDPRSVRNRKQ